ncbi:hypothetical protein SAMN03159341_107100 [Paenibacillus sp. 1_12]|uniref:hypothetical protein n=1 Tax=Paenibacillus sp. 1_12 TaxID=1566278 RepID=UPI0008EE2761|nr:hypothetical protein SAMN03159341_107100 [Paenibacillus sp. 1_12]
MNVVHEASRIASLFGIDPELAEQVGLLHDISNVIPKTKMMGMAEELLIEILEEERLFPRIVHQKLQKTWQEKHLE